MRVISEKFKRSLLDQVNPLCLSDEDGGSMVYPTRHLQYIDVLKRIHALSNPYYIDICFVIAELYPELNYTRCQQIDRQYFKPLGFAEFCFLNEDVRKNKGVYRNFIRALHSYCETQFDTYAFDSAFNEFVSELEYKQLMEQQKLNQQIKDQNEKESKD